MRTKYENNQVVARKSCSLEENNYLVVFFDDIFLSKKGHGISTTHKIQFN